MSKSGRLLSWSFACSLVASAALAASLSIAILLAQTRPAAAQQDQLKQVEQLQMGEWCKQELSEIRSQTRSDSAGIALAGAAGGAEQQERAADSGATPEEIQHLTEAARILGAHGRNDACRMVLFEVRRLLQYDGSKGTASP